MSRVVTEVGLLAAPGLAHELAERVSDDLARVLGRRFPDVSWRVEVQPEPRAAARDEDVDLEQIAHQRMLEEGWKFAVCLTDYPLHVGSRPVVAHASAASGVGLVSVPALGPVNLEQRVRDAIVRVIEGLLGESVDSPQEARDAERHARMRRRLEELSSLGRAEVHEGRAVRFLAAVGLGNVRLLMGMVRANRPWRLVAGLSRALVGALGLDIFGVASPGVWIVADGLRWPRLLGCGVASVLVTVTTLIAAHALWQKTYSERPEARERVVLFNLVTTITVVLGVLTLYLALLALNLVAAGTLITTAVLEKQLGHPADAGAYVALAWLVTSLATLGGALGAALEDDRTVRQAAYGSNPDVRNERIHEDGGTAQR
jgi:uncharacterized membrane protein